MLNSTKEAKTTMASLKPYPPCQTGGCTSLTCCSFGGRYKISWPELLGSKSQDAERVIQRENPNVSILTWFNTKPPPADFCCNRVVLILDNRYIVAAVPIVR